MKLHNVNKNKLKVLALSGLVLTATSNCSYSQELDSIRIKFEKEGNPEYPDNLYDNCPRTYDYFNRLMINYEKQYCGENIYNYLRLII